MKKINAASSQGTAKTEKHNRTIVPQTKRFVNDLEAKRPQKIHKGEVAA